MTTANEMLYDVNDFINDLTIYSIFCLSNGEFFFKLLNSCESARRTGMKRTADSRPVV